MTEEEQRENVKRVAREWLGTPYHHRARVKGKGVDCAHVLIEIFVEAGIFERFDPGKYSRDWHLHRGEEMYLQSLEKIAGDPIKADTSIHLWQAEGYKPLTGDVLLWRVGRTYSHGGVVTDWPYVVHASAPSQIVEEVIAFDTPVFNRPVRVYSFWRKQ